MIPVHGCHSTDEGSATDMRKLTPGPHRWVPHHHGGIGAGRQIEGQEEPIHGLESHARLHKRYSQGPAGALEPGGDQAVAPGGAAGEGRFFQRQGLTVREGSPRPHMGPVGCKSIRARRLSMSASDSVNLKTLWLPSSINASPGSPRRQLPS